MNRLLSSSSPSWTSLSATSTGPSGSIRMCTATACVPRTATLLSRTKFQQLQAPLWKSVPPNYETNHFPWRATASNRPSHTRCYDRYRCRTYSTRRILSPSAPFSSFRREKHTNSPSSSCPYKILNVPRKKATYKKVKASFLKIAMHHHPDTNQAESEEEEEESRMIFMRARKAFESFVENESGSVSIRQDEQNNPNTDEDFDEWFQGETGHSTPYGFLDPQTMKEVAEMEEKIGHGLDRDGGMWALAAMVSNAVKNGSDSATLLRLESGDPKDDKQIDGVLRRKRRGRR